LPGTLEEKINPFMDPIIGVLSEIYNSKEIKKMIANNVIEAVPLAYMRGRTFSNSFIILDEAQNTTQKQMSMFLTRFGRNIKCCITGDLLQSDLTTRENGLNWASSKLSPSDLVAFLTFTSEHVVRSPLVKEIMRYLYAEETSYPIKKTFRAGSLESIAPREVVNS
jgi:phosphate starvation-inducible PhoH-like protein